METKEKIQLLKSTIEQLYSKEGRSISYISKLLEVNRQKLSLQIKEWKLPEPKSNYYMKPSNKKQLNKHKQKIKSMLDKNYTIAEISKETNIPTKKITSIFCKYDDTLKDAYEKWQNRKKLTKIEKINKSIDKSSLDYEINPIPEEIWKPIKGYEKYLVSNFGRVKTLAKRYNKYYLIKAYPNINNNRPYIMLHKNNKKRKNLMLARVVAQTFIPHSEEKNTVNHIDGNVQNNKVSNLEWLTQADNNKHAFRSLKRKVVKEKRFKFDKLIYKGIYEFKTISALSRFINKSETQTRRYLENPEKHDIKLVCNCID